MTDIILYDGLEPLKIEYDKKNNPYIYQNNQIDQLTKDKRDNPNNLSLLKIYNTNVTHITVEQNDGNTISRKGISTSIINSGTNDSINDISRHVISRYDLLPNCLGSINYYRKNIYTYFGKYSNTPQNFFMIDPAGYTDFFASLSYILNHQPFNHLSNIIARFKKSSIEYLTSIIHPAKSLNLDRLKDGHDYEILDNTILSGLEDYLDVNIHIFFAEYPVRTSMINIVDKYLNPKFNLKLGYLERDFEDNGKDHIMLIYTNKYVNSNAFAPHTATLHMPRDYYYSDVNNIDYLDFFIGSIKKNISLPQVNERMTYEDITKIINQVSKTSVLSMSDFKSRILKKLQVTHQKALNECRIKPSDPCDTISKITI